MRLLDAAYDAGIRHFDVAPLYGQGEAAALFGEFPRGRRDKVTVTTKFGISHPLATVAGGLGSPLGQVGRHAASSRSAWSCLQGLGTSAAPEIVDARDRLRIVGTEPYLAANRPGK